MLSAKLIKGLNENIDLECPLKMIISFCLHQNCGFLCFHKFSSFANFSTNVHLLIFAYVKTFSFELLTSFSSFTHLNNRKYPIMNKRRMSTLHYSFDTCVETNRSQNRQIHFSYRTFFFYKMY